MPKIVQITHKDGKITKEVINKRDHAVRIKFDVYNLLIIEAAKNGRSITGEINYRLAQSLQK